MTKKLIASSVLTAALTAITLSALATPVAESTLSNPAMKQTKLGAQDLYNQVFSWLFLKYQSQNYNGQQWEKYEHRFDGKLSTEAEALAAINELLSSRNDSSLELFRANRPKSAKAGCTLANGFQVPGYFVVSITKDSPAARAGIHLQDLIKAVDSVPMSPSLSPQKASEMLSGPSGKTIVVQVDRFSKLTDISLTLTDKDPEPQSYCAMLKRNLAYIKPAFPLNPKSKLDQFKTAIAALKQSKAVGLVLDLRSNTEDMSNISDIADVCGCFVGTSPAFRTLFRGNSKVQSGKGTQLTNLPMVALIDDNTNTSAQAVAACLKTNKRATLIGEKTNGRNVLDGTVTVDRDFKLTLPISEYVSIEDIQGYQRGHVEPDIHELVYDTEILDGPWWQVSIGGKAPSPLDGKDVQLDLALNEIAIKSGASKGPRKQPRRTPPKNRIYF